MPEHKTEIFFGFAAALAVAGAAACGAPGQRSPEPTTATTSAAPAATSAAPAQSKSAAAAKTGKIPDVSGMSHQKAQDTMQAAGFYTLREVDGSGKGRMLLVDANWVQTGQSPAAGTVAPTDTVVTLTAIKYTDR
ncbi:PASTA domain-containing protein [Amycolatopsis minnesotensis]|uniref:PASTA domain-containing protein n=1 Tax=Amycolatopsis minnesotensis TaxID=337894 RepID=A0ABN2SLV4_9PSEU